jgi:hypothetical protein
MPGLGPGIHALFGAHHKDVDGTRNSALPELRQK